MFVLPGVSNNSGGWRWTRQAGRQIIRWMRGRSGSLSAKNNTEEDNNGSPAFIAAAEGPPPERNGPTATFQAPPSPRNDRRANICLF